MLRKMSRRDRSRWIRVVATVTLFIGGIAFIAFLLHRPSTIQKQIIRIREQHPLDEMVLPLPVEQISQSLLPIGNKHNRDTNRIAILIPFTVGFMDDHTNESQSQHRTTTTGIPTYMLAFCTGAVGVASVADFYIFHTTGIFVDEWPAVREICPSNVYFINVGTHQDLAQHLVLRLLDNRSEWDTTMDRHQLIDLVQSYLMLKPYALVEFKPALGHIFQTYLEGYSHWGYSDLDILFGDLGRWMTPDEWNDYDIVTYTFGDQQRLYLRGQFTMHRNQPTTINQIWRACNYLSRIDQRFARWIHHEQNYQSESAEGCYSAAVMNRTDLSVKFAVKAWTDIYKDDTIYSHGIFVTRGLNTNQQVLYKVDGEHMEVSARKISQLQPHWFEQDAVYMNPQNVLQREVGQRERIDLDVLQGEMTHTKCMYWAMPKYQTKLCLPDGVVSRYDTVFWIRGQLYKQRYENIVLPDNLVLTAPLFHFQEWKRSYRFEQVATMQPLSSVRTFALIPEGVIPMIDMDNPASTAAISPLGLIPLQSWTTDRSQLPGSMYCLVSGIDQYGKYSECRKAVSWRSLNQTHIVGKAPGWSAVKVESDVTLVLSLSITTIQVHSPQILQSLIDHLIVSLNHWRGQPSVVVISVASSTDEASTLLQVISRALNTNTKMVLDASLIAVVMHNETMVSRTALMNMAIDAVPTRWYLSGLEVERGLFLSSDAVFFAHRAAAAHAHLYGNLFLIPQFGAVGGNNYERNPGIEEGQETIAELHAARREHMIKNLAAFEKTCDEDDFPGGDKRLVTLDSIWWMETLQFVKTDTGKRPGDGLSQKATMLEELMNAIFALGPKGNEENSLSGLDDYPILLTDNLGPQNGIRTNVIAREVEAFAGLRCFNGIRLKYLALLGYSFDVLVGAFALSTESSREVRKQEDDSVLNDRCNVCAMFDVDSEEILANIANTETKRAAKITIMWAESNKMNKQ